MAFDKFHAQQICEQLEIYDSFFDDDNEEYQLLKENNPWLLEAFIELYALAESSETHQR